MEGPWKDQMGPMEGHGTSDGRMGGWWKVMEHQMEGHGTSDGRPWNIRWKAMEHQMEGWVADMDQGRRLRSRTQGWWQGQWGRGRIDGPPQMHMHMHMV